MSIFPTTLSPFLPLPFQDRESRIGVVELDLGSRSWALDQAETAARLREREAKLRENRLTLMHERIEERERVVEATKATLNRW